MTRRDLLKSMAAAAAMSAAEAMFPGILFAAAGRPAAGAAETAPSEGGVAWRKTPCRFCGVGCGLMVGIDNGRAVAVKGDPASPVNRGLCCVKGYHSVMALYGRDRLTRALVEPESAVLARQILAKLGSYTSLTARSLEPVPQLPLH